MKKGKNLFLLADLFLLVGSFIVLFSIWIRKTYGEFILAMMDSSFRNFFENKRSLFLMQVCVPVICFVIFVFILQNLFLKKLKKRTCKIYFSLTVFGGIIFLFISALLGGIYLKVDKYVRNQMRKQNEQWYDQNQIVMHALGTIDGHIYTNSFEALTQNYFEGGHRVFECDLLLTADNELVACHDWKLDEKSELSTIPTKQEFMETKIEGKYTPMAIEDIVQFMKEHSDIYLVTDTKFAEPEYFTNQFEKIVDAAIKNDCEEVLNRFVIQIYHPYMYVDINEIYPFKNWIFTLYLEGYHGDADQMEEYAKFCVANGIDVITMNKDYYSDELLKICDRYGLHLYVHTVKDERQKQEFLSKKVGIYVDE